MSSLEHTLKELESITDQITNIEVKQGSNALVDSLLSRKRNYVRDADENENIVAELRSGTPLSNVMDIVDTSKRLTEDDIMPALRSAAKINEICEEEEIEEKISYFLALYDDRRLNIDNLKDQIAKTSAEIDMLTARNTELNTMSTMDYEDDLQEEEAEIKQLEAALLQKRATIRRLVKQKADVIRIGEDLKPMALTSSSNTQLTEENKHLIEEIEQLKKKRDELKKRIAAYDTPLNTPEETQVEETSATIDELFAGLCTYFEDLLKNSFTTSDTDSNTDNLISKLKAIETELEEMLTKTKMLKAHEDKKEEAKLLYYHILTFINQRIMQPNQPNGNDINFEKFNKAFPHNTKTTVPQVPLAKEAVEISCIILKLYTDGGMPLFDLTNYVESITEKDGISKSAISMAIYKLAANNLISIDRSHKDTLIELKLNTI